MSKNITKQIEELEDENARLLKLKKYFDQAVKSVFGYNEKTIKKILKEYEKNNQDA